MSHHDPYSIARALALDPSHFMSYYNLGYLYQDMAKLNRSIECFENAIRLQPTDIDSYINLALVLMQSGAIERAVQSYRDVLCIDSTCVMAHYNLGNVYQAAKQYTLAIECFTTVVTLDITHADAWFNRAIAYQDRSMLAYENKVQDLKEALYSYQQVVRLSKIKEAIVAAEQVEEMIRKELTQTIM